MSLPRNIQQSQSRSGRLTGSSGLTAALLSGSPGEARIDVGGSTHSGVHFASSSAEQYEGALGSTPDQNSSFLVGSPWGGPRSGASLFLRPTAAAGGAGSMQRPSFDQTRRSMSRTHSVPEVPDLEADPTGFSSREASQPLLNALHRPPLQPDSPMRDPLGSPAKPDADAELLESADGKAATAAAATKARSLYTAVVYGSINGIVGLPTMISFVAIIFKDPTYSKYLGQLAKLGFFASGIHQAVFTVFSTLPYAVGQVQDVGLIFLSAMATSIAAVCGSPELALGTSLTWLSISTVLTGVAIIAVGKKKLATLVQYIPIQVVGAYLSYVAYFCVAAGIGLGIGYDIGTISSWRLLAHTDALVKLGPTLAATFALLVTLKCCRNPLALPMVLCAIPALFHVVRIALGHSMEDATRSGWVMRGEGGGEPFWAVYELFNWKMDGFKLEGVQWSAMPRQIPSLIALFLVVTFGSALDVAAIQQDTPYPLDFNSELVTVGISNVVAGCVGAGMTGSYIFSQTIFSMRAGVSNRLHGAIIAIMELSLFFAPISIVQYMPNFFYGSLLVMFGIDIGNDWLVHSFSKVTRAEYVLLLLSFFAILQTGLEVGILAGIVASTFYFAFQYSRAHVSDFSILPSRSGVMRTYDQRIVLDVLSEHMVVISMSGFVFFGSSLAISDKIFKVVEEMLQRDAAAGVGTLVDAGGRGQEEGLEERARAAVQSCPRLIVMDFKRVQGLDATAARTLGTLFGTLQGKGVEMLIACLPAGETARLLRAHGIPIAEGVDAEEAGACRCFPTLDDALVFCEQAYLQVAAEEGLCELNPGTKSLADILRMHLAQPQALFSEAVDAERAARDLQRVMKRRQLAPREPLFTAGDASEELYFITAGHLTQTLSFHSEDDNRLTMPGTTAPEAVKRVFTYGPGSILGQADFFMRQPRTATSVAASDGCMLHVIARPAFDVLRQKSPEALIILTSAMLRASAVTEMHAIDTLGANQL